VSHTPFLSGLQELLKKNVEIILFLGLTTSDSNITANMDIQNEHQMPIMPAQDRRSTSTIFQERTNSTIFRDLNNEELPVLVTLAINTLDRTGPVDRLSTES
jgi:hypothetical protein